MGESRLLLDPVVAAVIPAIDEVTAIGPLVAGRRKQGVCCMFVVDAARGTVRRTSRRPPGRT